MGRPPPQPNRRHTASPATSAIGSAPPVHADFLPHPVSLIFCRSPSPITLNMLSTFSSSSSSVAPRHISCFYPLPNYYLFSPHHRPCKVALNSKRHKFYSVNNSIVKLAATLSCSSKEREKEQKHPDTGASPCPDTENFDEFCSFTDLPVPEPQPRTGIKERGDVVDSSYRPIFSKLWWVKLKAALGQRINLEAIACFVWVLFRNNRSAIPHVTVPDIRYIDWAELKNKGFRGVVFDKDNTITVPYTLSLCPPLGSSLELCKSLFGTNIAVFSNSAGLREYDHDGRKAAALEDAIGIKVIRHRVKKPAGTAEEIESHVGCEASRLIMVGDRPFTDIVYGNRNGFFTILTEALSHKEEPWIVRQVRWLEGGFLRYLSIRGQLPIGHRLVPHPAKCIKKVPL